MFRIEKGKHKEYVIKSIRMPVDLVMKYQSLADTNELSFNALIIQALEYAVSHMEPEEEPK